MDSFLQRFNLTKLPTKHHTELLIGDKFKMLFCDRVDTKYGASVVAIVESVEDSKEQMKIFLGKKYSSLFTDEIINAVNQKKESFIVEYRGEGYKKSPVYLIEKQE